MNKQRKIAFLILISMIISMITTPMFSVSVNAAEPKNGDVIGNVLNSNIKNFIDEYRIPSYIINSKAAIILNDLKNYGFDVNYDNATRTSSVTHNPNKKITPITDFEESSAPSGTIIRFQYVYTDIVAKVNGKVVPSFNIRGYLAIFFEDLKDYGIFNYSNATRESKFTSNRFVTAIKLDKAAATIKVNESLKLNATITPANATNKTLTWTSSNAHIAAVDNSGNVKGVAAGTTTITARASNGLTATCTVTVQPATIDPTSITLDRATAALNINESVRLNATVSPSNATDRSVTWSSSNTNIATVDINGNVRGTGNGTATITARTVNGLTAACTVTVAALPTGISLDKTTAAIGINESLKLNATITPSNVVDKTVTWSSSNTSIATVDSNGNVRGIGNGTATITARTVNGYTATCTVTVGAAVTKVTISGPTTIQLGSTITLSAVVEPSNAADKTVTWSSSNPTIARVDNSTGNSISITGLAAGSATITAKASNGVSATYSVTVGIAPTSISVSPTSTTLSLGQSTTLTATLLPSGAMGGVTWASSNTSVATVNSSSGVVTAINTGTATITATTSNGYSATCTVTVGIVPTSITITPSAVLVEVGKTVALTATITPLNATNQTVTWSSSNTSVATVNNSGVVTASSSNTGQATITATTSNGISASCTITVQAAGVAVTGVTLDRDSLTLKMGETSVTLNATVMPIDATDKSVTWTSSNTAVAEVTPSGTVVQKGVGTAIITVRTTNGNFTAQCVVIVQASDVIPAGG